MLLEAAAFGQVKGRDDVGRAARFEAEDMVHHVHHLVLLDQFARGGGVGLADAGIEEFQELVDFGAGAHGGARVVRVHLLLDGDGGGEACDAFHVGLVESAHELPCIRTQALHITALAFGIQSVERQGRLTRPREAGNDHQLVLRDLQTNAFQVVDLRVADGDIGWFVFFQDAKIESAKVQKSGEIGEGDEENNKKSSAPCLQAKRHIRRNANNVVFQRKVLGVDDIAVSDALMVFLPKSHKRGGRVVLC